MSSSLENLDDKQMAKFFRGFELITEFREIMYTERSLTRHLPKLINGAIEYQFLPYYFSDVPNWRLALRKLMAKERIAPDYVMTGPGKSGSSDLVSHLLFHPNVLPPLAKEPKMYKVKNWHMGYPTVKEKQQAEEKVGGPVRCGYLDPEMHRLDVMDKLYELNPNCKVIIVLRDPVARAYSYWKWELFMGSRMLKGNKKLGFFNDFDTYIERAIDLFPSIPMETFCGHQVLADGIYFKAVERWINRFGRDNVMVSDVAEYFKDRKPILGRIQKFLDLPLVNIPEYSKKANENPIKLPPADKKTKEALASFYRPYNEKLFELLGCEFQWQ
ncbi:hypothetical protein N480_25385 [Pseudoalteromonas luteoviolacea S2607]|uniref:sulfotransferase domain-containing protein n=1 Tax=Pseudoalteromonas luteoviolacea TaxID=43657 RepID=UPI0007B0AA7F|nr:sulfotransferase domain-containing protein [Pseudoalteromonas luteoviolacea]KZN32586.1 hypothetical protein N480_25385 [Pseudoalteromonas luteoviolacea S2607]